MPPVTATRSNLTLQAYDHIYRMLWQGELAVGCKLPEVALAKQIGVSRTPVREAVAQLESEGFLIQIPNTGSFVRMMQRDELDELFGFRIHLECYALQLVTQSPQIKLINKLDRICSSMFELLRKTYLQNNNAKATLRFAFEARWYQLDAQFHELILQSANNRWIKRVSSQLHLMSRIFMPGRIISQDADPWKRAIRIWREHRRIVRSIRQENLELGHHILHHHIEHGRLEAMQFMDWVDEHINDKPAQRRKLQPELAQMLENIIRLRDVMAANKY